METQNTSNKKLWFKRKTYGWGWTPMTWEGWVATLVYVMLLLAFLLTLDVDSSGREIMFMGVLPTVLLTIAFIRLTYHKGETPRWQWGTHKKERQEMKKEKEEGDTNKEE